MPVTNNEFLSSAQKIIEHGGEISYRNAASRAYYAAYHKTKILIDNGLVQRSKSYPWRGGMHRKFFHDLRLSTDRSIREIAQLLEMCYTRRIEADYDLSELFNISDAKSAIGIAEAISKLVDEIIR